MCVFHTLRRSRISAIQTFQRLRLATNVPATVTVEGSMEARKGGELDVTEVSGYVMRGSEGQWER